MSSIVDLRSIIIQEGERLVTPPSTRRETRYFLKFGLLSERVRFKPKMWNSNHHHSLLQQGHGNLEAESEESYFSQENEVSQASQGMESSQVETEHLEPWSRIFDEAEKRHETQLNALINQLRRERRFRKRGSY